ncbi:MAG: hypothetical protein QOI54_3383 [Actinomycetota bacterium]|jgi:hypothetical protein|nr:hypothetical protein [Actinomycetota bacterium]
MGGGDIRPGDTVVSELTPLDQASARVHSISAVHGLDAQPLHSDGAHLLIPPDVVILEAEEPSVTPTLLWTSLDDLLANATAIDALREGLFLVRNGAASFYTPAFLRPQEPRKLPQGELRSRGGFGLRGRSVASADARSLSATDRNRHFVAVSAPDLPPGPVRAHGRHAPVSVKAHPLGHGCPGRPHRVIG